METNVELNAKVQPKEGKCRVFKSVLNIIIKNKAALVGMIIILLLILMALLGKFIMPYDPYVGDLSQSLQAPSSAHIFGTDEQGRDILSRIIDGTKISLRVGVTSVAIALSIGTVIGSLSGYYGGKVDMFLMRIMDIILAFPSLLLAIAFMSALGKGIDKAVIAISIVTIPEYARIVRGCILSVKENEYVQAAKVIGNNDITIIFKHILPNVMSPIIVRATLGISTAILETSALGFLGLGVEPPLAEWGSMLGAGRGYFYNAPHIVLFPGIAITLTVLAFNLFGDGLRDALDPKLRK
ncbi:peptide/nickel transport system permease protein/oligopeptide transport system permease protein [Clostridium tetanomorphum]|uniref:ABC transporter permease n=1 Tax=Clostridium tetanomorphum TaxID=1553 RepID=A0A923J2B5_CLOTT|nr:nickel transporter permease [Clostridium tetanomorphum]KAJ49356.1 glutathione transport system permease protein GsiD [Clostridium tetanomorphum DSM 665]KAJ53321.1 glutathione transport system permease protein GsiD [Clostridium tetanomorphum DSM 665]MBC2400091.1 ABC transporter permease [Clostridium tetanomorphum]MBP1866272.1 peptide/nickel transport system permease protein/oligopeptide transport system permease protein [Clostridium tetanomorphum]NRS86042.1 peptide/nickel transport system pe